MITATKWLVKGNRQMGVIATMAVMLTVIVISWVLVTLMGGVMNKAMRKSDNTIQDWRGFLKDVGINWDNMDKGSIKLLEVYYASTGPIINKVDKITPSDGEIDIQLTLFEGE